MHDEHRLLTVREVADEMRVSTMTVYRLIRGDAFPAIRVGKHFRIRTSDLGEYLGRSRAREEATRWRRLIGLTSAQCGDRGRGASG